ncbi:RtcB family protein [Desulfosediminicola flagellatus]|uniref:RtcB family protein n=1 Tax=Desulfosediminicola flagellatus TaxID=2569541 RepID=UPI0010AD4B80|nr:RtcB family protein [Desulfosediminicola flagellatus]
MKSVISTETKPIKMWLNDIDAEALSQARNLANLPFIYKHVAIMPDAHCGYGMPIGGVLATTDAVIPNAVGVDIGCGMCAVRTSLTEIDKESLKTLLGSPKEKRGIRGRVPVGFKHHERAQDESYMPDTAPLENVQNSRVMQLYQAAKKQVGTLGGGNHFIEIQHGDDNHIWIIIHSGSRNIGLQIARHYNQLAIKLNERWKTSVPRKWDLAFLPLNTSEASNYLAEMQFCVEFALANRKLMMERVQQAIEEVVGSVQYEPLINIAHNYAAVENHFNEHVIVHRKGATRARTGDMGIIPGSQGSSSYIVVGKGNPESFSSCSHGAGRVLGRKQAQRTLDLEAEQSRLDELGIIHGMRSKRDLDEAPSAYKNIDRVMENQQDLVDIAVRLKPLAVVKG